MDFESIYETAKLATTYGGIVLGSYATVFCGLSVANAAGREITSPKELEAITAEESKALGFTESPRLEVREGNRAFAESAQESNSWKDTIALGGISRKRKLVRHELFHLKRLEENHHLKKLFTSGEGALSATQRKLQYFFIEEPLALMYGTFGIKMGLKNEEEKFP